MCSYASHFAQGWFDEGYSPSLWKMSTRVLILLHLDQSQSEVQAMQSYAIIKCSHCMRNIGSQDPLGLSDRAHFVNQGPREPDSGETPRFR